MWLRERVERAWWRQDVGGLASLLWPLSGVYGLLRWALQWPWRANRRQPWRAPVPVVVVGNLVVGGAGKTPVVMALAQRLAQRGWRPGIVSRGYGRRRQGDDKPSPVALDAAAEGVGDEPLLMARRTGRPVWVGARRAHAVQALCAHHPDVNVVICDDGLQHLALHRDAQVLVFDDRGAGNGLLLPAGPLREPLPRELPVRTVVVYNAAQPSTALAGDCGRRRLKCLTPLTQWWQGAAAGAPAATGLDAWRGRRVLAAAGIGHPERFFRMLEDAGLEVDRLPLADHAPLTPRPWHASASVVVVTEKDAVKLPPDAPDAAAILVATLDFEIPDSTVEALEQWLLPLRRN